MSLCVYRSIADMSGKIGSRTIVSCKKSSVKRRLLPIAQSVAISGELKLGRTVAEATRR
jgi:hypothetical protein